MAGAEPAGAGRPLLAGGLLVASGLIDMVSAYANTVGDPFMAVTRRGVYPLDITGWAWLHVAIGAAVAIAGLAAVTGRPGTTGTAIGCAALAVVVDVLLFPYAPVRAIFVVSLTGAAVRLLVRRRRAVGAGGGALSGVGRSGR